MSIPTAIIYDDIYKKHHTGAFHPEKPERSAVIIDAIKGNIPSKSLIAVKPKKASVKDVMLCHDPEYIEMVSDDVVSGFGQLSTGDTNVCEESMDVALYAVGAGIAAADAIYDGKIKNAFCAVRPPGHHAESKRGMGFCIFNNAAICARYVQTRHNAERVLIADWDVHHGNGTQEIFYKDNTVFFFSTHQWPHYPGTGIAAETGIGAGKGFTMNCPFPGGSGRREIVGAFKEKLVPAMKEFKPQFVVISAGFDSRQGDMLGGFHLSDADFTELTEIVLQIADTYAGGRCVSFLEGGYELNGLASAATAHVAALAKA